MTLFKGNFADFQRTGNLIIKINRVKLNYTYRRRKNWQNKQNPRIKEFDLGKYEEFCNEMNVNLGYDGKTNDFWVELKDFPGDVIEINGWNTGGQLVRAVLQIAANSGNGRTNTPQKLELEPFKQSEKTKNGKSSMLQGTQTRIWTLRVNDTFSFTGGDSTNTDALHWEKHNELFKLFSSLLGYNFTLKNLIPEDDKPDHFILERLADTPVLINEVKTSEHYADQIMMSIIVNYCKAKFNTNEEYTPREITIKYPSGIDFHPDAMIKLARAVGIKVRDNKPCYPDTLENETETELEMRHLEIVKEWVQKTPERITTFW